MVFPRGASLFGSIPLPGSSITLPASVNCNDLKSSLSVTISAGKAQARQGRASKNRPAFTLKMWILRMRQPSQSLAWWKSRATSPPFCLNTCSSTSLPTAAHQLHHGAVFFGADRRADPLQSEPTTSWCAC